MQDKKNNKNKKIILIILAVLALVVLIAALVTDKINTKNNLQALNEAILNTKAVTSGSATGYTLSYPEKKPEAPTRADRKLVYTKDKEGAYTFLESTTDQTGHEIYSRMYGKPGEYYNDLGDHWEKKNTAADARATPYSISRLTSAVSQEQISSIKKIEIEGRIGYKISFNHQWLVASYTGIGAPIDSEITYMIGKTEDKNTVDSVTQKLRNRINTKEEKYISVVEESIFFRAKETEDKQAPDKYLKNYFDEKIKDNWKLEEIKTETPPSPNTNPAPTVGESEPKK